MLQRTSGREALGSVFGGHVTGADGRRDWLEPQASIGLGTRKRGCWVQVNGQQAFPSFQTRQRGKHEGQDAEKKKETI
jgi:hypothetical protein